MFPVVNPTRDEVTKCSSFLVVLAPSCCGFLESGVFLEGAADSSVQATIADMPRRPLFHGAQLHHQMVIFALVMTSAKMTSAKRHTSASCCYLSTVCSELRTTCTGPTGLECARGE